MAVNGRQWVVAHQSRRALAADYLHVMNGLVTSLGRTASRVASPDRPHHTLYRRGGKRVLDVFVGSALLVLAAPLLALTAAVVRLGLGSPVLFKQKRPGRNGRPFVMYKFRTMREVTDEQGRARPDAERLTRIGGWLRRHSLDELPELVNVVRGEMSLVGPRPLLMQYLDRYTPAQARRHEVRPGITGLAQVSGRNALAWPQRFALDVSYVDRCGLALDVTIALRTVWALVTREGIDEPGRVSVTEFMGGS
jgi:lipopolysaccharide/colanic/teichoic acid biosynthesis glycosyltransferase